MFGFGQREARGEGCKKFNKLEIANYVSYIVILKFLKMQSIGQEVMSAPEKQGAEEELMCKMSIKTLSRKVKDGGKKCFAVVKS